MKNKYDAIKIKQMIASGALIKDIANYYGVRANTMGVALRKMKIVNTNSKKIMGTWNAKHAHLRLAAMTYFINHSFEQTKNKFKLSESELKSLMTVAYQKPEFMHLRKDKRRKDRWTENEIKAVLQHCGLRPRSYIASVIGKGNARVIKEKLMNLSVRSPKYINGITISQFRDIFSKEPELYIETDAGPNSGAMNSGFFKIVPWVYIEDAIRAKDLDVADVTKSWVSAMAEFQEWIHDGNAYGNVFDISMGVKKFEQKYGSGM